MHQQCPHIGAAAFVRWVCKIDFLFNAVRFILQNVYGTEKRCRKV